VTPFLSIPQELRDLPRWVVWRWEPDPEKPDKPRKPPFCAADLRRHASSTNEATWSTFEKALSVIERGKADGLGFALEAPYVLVDLDSELSLNDQYALMLALDSYAEVSPSGEGHHVLVKAHLNGDGRHPTGIGVFQRARFCYCTGELVQGMRETIEEREFELAGMLKAFLAPAATDVPPIEPAMPEFAPAHLLARLKEEPGDRSVQSLQFIAACVDAGLDDAAVMALALEHRPTVSKYGSESPTKDRRKTEVARTISKIRGTALELTRASESVELVGDFLGEEGATDLLTQPYRVSKSESLPSVGYGTDSEAESVTVPERPFSLPVSEFVALERPNVEPLLADADGRATIGRNSLTLLGALGGHGKTTFAIDLFLHLAAGVDYPPFTVPRPVSILMVENEGPEQLFADKLAARLERFPHELRGRLDICTFDWGGFSLADETHRKRLTSEIAVKGYDLVFGDPLDSLGIEGVGSPEDTRKFLALMKETGLHKTVAWWLNTHPRKDETREALNEISGAWGGKPDSVLLLRMLDGDRTKIRQPKLRWARRGKGPTLLYGFEPDTEAFTYLGEQSEEERDYLGEIGSTSLSPCGRRRRRSPARRQRAASVQTSTSSKRSWNAIQTCSSRAPETRRRRSAGVRGRRSGRSIQETARTTHRRLPTPTTPPNP
jgi:hypothetical protein